jgi:type III secretion protein J
MNTAFLKGLLAGLLALALAACTQRVELMAAMPEQEANEVLAALQNAGIKADKTPGKEGMVGVSLDASQVGRAVDLLRAKGLPRERFAGMGQVFKKEGLISSPLEERARYLYALSQELGATLSQIDGVIVARVHVVLPERGNVGDPSQPSSAAVFIKHQEGYNIEGVLPQIRRLVNNSIPGLTPEKISIVLVGAQAKAESAGGAAPAPRPDASPANGNGWTALWWGLAAVAIAGAAGAGFWFWRRRRSMSPAPGAAVAMGEAP